MIKTPDMNEEPLSVEKKMEAGCNVVRRLKIVLVRCPQPVLIGEETGSMYSPNRQLTPEPTLPQLEGILRDIEARYNISLDVCQIDLRDPTHGKIEDIQYGELTLPYIRERILKTYHGIRAEVVLEEIADADVVGFTNNFAMSRGVVRDHMRKVRETFPDKEIWVGGRDLASDSVIDIYASAANRKNLTVFHGHVFDSLPAYLLWMTKGKGEPHGIRKYGREGEIIDLPVKPLNINGPEIDVPLPIYKNPALTQYFTGSGEGQADPPFNRFAHVTFSIGCPHACGYCTTGYRERYMVCKKMSGIEAELQMYKDMGISHLGIMDDNLLALGVEKVRAIMTLVNSAGFLVEYGNGLQLRRLNQQWDEFKDPVFSRCASLYAPLEDLTRDLMYEKLESTQSQYELLRRISDECPPNLKYLTMGAIIGVPGHTKRVLSTTFLENVEKFLGIFKGKDLEVAATIFSLIPLSGTRFGDMILTSDRMVIPNSMSEHPEIFNFGVVSYAPDGMACGDVYDIYERSLNLNPAGKELGVDYVTLQRLGEKAVPENKRGKIPNQWRVPGYHLRDKVK
jgi:hypothetical protein